MAGKYLGDNPGIINLLKNSNVSKKIHQSNQSSSGGKSGKNQKNPVYKNPSGSKKRR